MLRALLFDPIEPSIRVLPLVVTCLEWLSLEADVHSVSAEGLCRAYTPAPTIPRRLVDIDAHFGHHLPSYVGQIAPKADAHMRTRQTQFPGVFKRAM
jgi:hypothetical protein